MDVAVPVVAAGFQRRVEYPASRSAHLRIVRIHLDFDLGDRVDIRDEDRPVAQVRNRNPVDQIIVCRGSDRRRAIAGTSWSGPAFERRRGSLYG